MKIESCVQRGVSKMEGEDKGSEKAVKRVYHWGRQL